MSQNSGSERKIRLFDVGQDRYVELPPVEKSDVEWKRRLTEEQYHVTREEGTEAPFSGELVDNKESGIYQCVACGTDLFLSEAKFESGTGWPSFWKPVADENVGLREDGRFFMKRVEVHCARCDAHLGHVFEDGPPPTHQRFCMNSAALSFQPCDERK